MAKKAEKIKVRCIDCKHAFLMQWNKDPIIVQCSNLSYRDVASTPRICDFFAKRYGDLIVKHFKY